MPDIPNPISRPTSSAEPDRCRARFARGARLGLPIFLGYVPVGMAFGVLARQLGFSVAESTLCSATALAGAGQFIALSLLKGGATATATLIATGVVNLRYLLFSTTLSPHVRRVTPWSQAWLAFTLTDETFAINIADIRRGDASAASMAGVGAIAWTGWVLGTLAGSAAAGWIGDPTKWGMDFAMPAMFAALFVALAENRRHVAIGVVGASVVLVLPLAARLGVAIDSAWFIVIAALFAATVGSVAFSER